MNINDIDKPDEIPENIWPAIFEKQKALLEKYREIEGMPTSFNIDTAETQRWIKDFAWRVTEEICEALEAKKNGMDDEGIIDEEHYIHYLEELTDALHFITELTIIAGFDSDILDNPIMSYNEYDIVYYLGLMCNCLKNKPWKQTQMLTDRPKFKSYLQASFERIWGIFLYNGLENKDIYTLYFKKNAVNQFRIRSKY